MLDIKSSNRNYFIFALIFIIMSFFIVQSFMFGILWGAVTALSVWPIFEKISNKNILLIGKGTKNHALIFAIIFCLLFLVPFLYGIYELGELYKSSTHYIATNSEHGVLNYPSWFESLPMKEKLIDFWNTNIATSSGLIEAVDRLSSGKLVLLFSSLWTQVLDRVITTIVMIISFYFMLKNGDTIKKNYKNIFSYWLSPRGLGHIENGILALRGTINGVVLIGVLEGILLAVPLTAGGLNSGFLIGLAAGLLGVIPLLMPLLIAPCLLYLYMTGNTLWAIIGAVDLVVVWFMFENIVKPQMISKKVKINSVIILISMIGGMQLMGPVGLFLGPSIVSMAIGMIRDFLASANS
ncbi:MAG: AI-2E family transporter [Bacteriovorax sp.]|nr:AI-2E family transporter [Bacteriovorax sp.]